MGDTVKKALAFPEEIWAGTDHSLALAMQAYEKLMAGVFDRPATEAAAPAPYLFNVQGNIGVVTVRGPLVNRDSPYNQYLGVTSYGDIRKAMIFGAMQDGVKAILLDVDSGGGAVNGMMDTHDLIASINKSVKPVYAFTGGMMASAAYGISAAADKVFVASTAMSGSVGVIATHTEYSKLLKEMGIGVTVIRSGEFKALASAVEPLSETALKQIQGQLDAAYGVFATAMADDRGVTLAQFEKSMGQGREFFGAQAVEAGMADGVKNFDSTMSWVANQIDKNANKGNTLANSPRGANMSRQALTEQTIAALAAAGITEPTAVAAAVEKAIAAMQTPEALAAAAAEKAKVDAAAAAAAAVTAAAATAATPAATNDGVIAYLQAQIKDKDATAVASAVEIAGLKKQVATMEATHTGLVAIAAQSVTNMKVALGLPKIDMTKFDATALLADHAATEEQFKKAFKVGGVAAISAEDPAKPKVQADASLHKARIEATRSRPVNK